MSKKSKPSLAEAGERLWDEVSSAFELRADELRLLEQACKTLDMIARLEDAWSELGCPMVSTGSMGQEVIHPLIGELRAQRAAFDRLRAALKLTDEDDAPVEDSSSKARRAAVARWSRGA